MSRDIVLKYWKIIRYKTLIIQCVPEGTPIKRFCYESSVGKPCAFTGKACSDFKCIDRVDGLRVRYNILFILYTFFLSLYNIFKNIEV